VSGIVYIVGAGPGDPGLITLKGLRYLMMADVVVYDRLVNPVLLHKARRDAELIYVGRDDKGGSIPQELINEILISRALSGKVVVRLKGGDPFVFGRGGEEMLALLRAGVKFEIVPGVTSGIAVPASVGIPLTFRGLSSSAVFLTGHEYLGKGKSSIDWRAVSKIDTIIIFMGLSNIEDIVSRLIENGLPADKPVAVIQNGTTEDQIAIFGKLKDICVKVREAEIKSPALIIVGDVVKLGMEVNKLTFENLKTKEVIKLC
jgi:uroporphyrinogen III methyltransferase/synthase